MKFIPPYELDLIRAITDRAAALDEANRAKIRKLGIPPDVPKPLDCAYFTAMLAGCHMNARRLDLRKLLASDDYYFWHDCSLIRHGYNPFTERLHTARPPHCALPIQTVRATIRRSEPDDDLMEDMTHPGLAALAGNTNEGEDE